VVTKAGLTVMARTIYISLRANSLALGRDK